MDSPAGTSRSVSVDTRDGSNSLLRRSLHAVGDLFSPFSAAAVASLPNLARPQRYHRADAIPDASSDDQGQMPTVRDYHAINSLPAQVRIPKKIPTAVKVEAKVWFANERSEFNFSLFLFVNFITLDAAWIAWLNISILLGTLALALFNASKDEIATRFAYGYAIISVGVLIYGFALYHLRISMIRRRDPGHFDSIAGPVILGIVLFTVVLANFIVRVRELKRKEVPIPGAGLFTFLQATNKTLEFYTQH
ncbi:hypothetical protein C0991_001075 [Blastosporella zonata]|nr:hypothetical protein C0991_001075 [Blastosporella zonata]